MTPGLHLVLPGLLDPVDDADPEGLGATPALDLLLTRAHVEPMQSIGLVPTLFSLFGYQPQEQHDLPSAAVCRLGEGGNKNTGFWLHSDPVAIHPMRDGLVLLGNADLGITREEADSLVGLVNKAFAAEGWSMEAVAPDRWYLCVPRSSGLKTCRLEDAVGRDVKTCLPAGAYGGLWRRVLNEIQMLFHDAEVNRNREECGHLPVNSVWLYGAGELPDGLESPFECVLSGHPLAKGLAFATATRVVEGSGPLPELAAGTGGAGLLWVVNGLSEARPETDVLAARRLMGQIESALADVLSLLRKRRLAEVVIYPCDGRRFRVDAEGIRRFWKRRRPLSYFAASSSSRVRK